VTEIVSRPLAEPAVAVRPVDGPFGWIARALAEERGAPEPAANAWTETLADGLPGTVPIPKPGARWL
jgi:hypothetical protein